MNKILIVESEFALAEKLCRAFSDAEIRAFSCGTLEAATALLEREKYQMVIVDTELSDGDGYDLIYELGLGLYLSKDPVIIVIMPNERRPDSLELSEQGITDYITKPFSTAVLKAKVCTQLRRRKKYFGLQQRERFETVQPGIPESVDNENKIIIDAYVFDFDTGEYTVAGKPVKLGSPEQSLLRILIENKGTVMNRRTLIDKLEKESREHIDEETLAQTVRLLGDKLKAHDYIKTIYGVGYIWDNSEKNYEDRRR